MKSRRLWQTTLPITFPLVSLPFDFPLVSLPFDFPLVSLPFDFTLVSLPFDFPLVSLPFDFPLVSLPFDFPLVSWPFDCYPPIYLAIIHSKMELQHFVLWKIPAWQLDFWTTNVEVIAKAISPGGNNSSCLFSRSKVQMSYVLACRGSDVT